MFVGRLVNRYSGVSKKGNDFFTLDIFVDVDNGGRVLCKSFVDRATFDKASGIPLDSPISVRCGVNAFGNLCIKDVSKADLK